MTNPYPSYGANSRFSQQYNPWIYYFPFPSIVSVVAFNFYPEYFSNGTYGSGGVANYESISSIVGAQLNKKTGQFEYVPEVYCDRRLCIVKAFANDTLQRWPEQGWYRRDREYGAVEALADGFTRIYPAVSKTWMPATVYHSLLTDRQQNPVPMPIAQLGTPNFNVTTILCDLYQGLNSITPLELGGQTTSYEASIGWALGKLAGQGLSDSILGCPKNAVNNNYGLYPNSTTAGGPLGPDPVVVSRAGNNVYNKVYFTSAPTTPQCH